MLKDSASLYGGAGTVVRRIRLIGLAMLGALGAKAGGAPIGRSADCSASLPDQKRAVSAKRPVIGRCGVLMSPEG